MEYQQCSLHKHHHLCPGERHLRQPQVQLPRLQMESQVQVPGLVQLQMTQLELSHQQWKLQLSQLQLELSQQVALQAMQQVALQVALQAIQQAIQQVALQVALQAMQQAMQQVALQAMHP